MSPRPSLRLADLPTRQPGVVHGVVAPATRPEWQRQLTDLGFVPGEPVQVLTRAWPGGDPMVVRVAGSTYALRRAEAACVVLQG